MYNCIIKALNRTISNIAVNFSSNDGTVRVITDGKRTSAEQTSQRAIKSTSSAFVTSTPKNAKQAKRHYSTPVFDDDDSFELKSMEQSLNYNADESKINYLAAEISGDIYQSFNEAEVFSSSSQQDDGDSEDGVNCSKEHGINDDDNGEKFVHNDVYWEDDILDFLLPEVDICSNLIDVRSVGLFKNEAA